MELLFSLVPDVSPGSGKEEASSSVGKKGNEPENTEDKQIYTLYHLEEARLAEEKQLWEGLSGVISGMVLEGAARVPERPADPVCEDSFFLKVILKFFLGLKS